MIFPFPEKDAANSTVLVAMKRAMNRAKRANREEISPDDLLVGLLQTIARFNVAQIGPWTIDLEEPGEVSEESAPNGVKVKYSVAAVEIFNRAAATARRDGDKRVAIVHLLVAFANETQGLMKKLRQDFSLSSAEWRSELPRWQPVGARSNGATTSPEVDTQTLEEKALLSPDEAAQLLGVHYQTIRGYIRRGQLPAFRLAGERALRIKREDLLKLLEPFSPD